MDCATRSLLQLGSWQQCGLVALRAAMCRGMLRPVYAGAVEQISSLRSYSTEPVRHGPKIFAACVLERLPIVKSPPPEWEAEYKAWTQMRKVREGMIKQYPILDRKQRSQEDADQTQLNLVPAVTKADQQGVASTMKRRLAEKLVLLVKARQDPAAAASSSAAAAGPDVWTFPWTAHDAGETIRDTAERALREAIGPSQVYFVGNAPMAHLDLRSSSSAEQQPPQGSTTAASDLTTTTTSNSTSNAEQQQLGQESAIAASDATTTTTNTSSSNIGPFKKQPPDGRLFFHLATVVNDPWDVSVSDAVAADHAWVSRDELQQYIKNNRLLALAHQML